jgi:hypothetical protein
MSPLPDVRDPGVNSSRTRGSATQVPVAGIRHRSGLSCLRRASSHPVSPDLRTAQEIPVTPRNRSLAEWADGGRI